MLVRDRMTRDPITIREDTVLPDALKVMRDNRIRRLPVVNKDGKLVGMVAEKDLLYASSPPATTLSVWELSYLVARIKVGQLMSREVISVSDDCPLEEAARIMADNQVSGLPVMRGDTLIGIITETDLFKTFLEFMGAREQGTRFTIKVPQRKGMLAALAQRVADLGGNIVALGTFSSNDPTMVTLTTKIQDVDKDELIHRWQELGIVIEDVREV